MAKSFFKVDKFTNPSGETAWRVSGTLNGMRIRKNFKSKAEAQAEKQTLEIRALNEQSEGQTVWTTLTHEQNRDAIAAVNLLKEASSRHSLVKAVDYFIKNYREAERECPVNEAVIEYLDERSRDVERSIIGEPQYNDIKSELNWFSANFGEQLVSSLTAEALKDYLNSPRQSPRQRRKPPRILSLKTVNNRRGLLNTFIEYCKSRKYTPFNPVEEIPQHRIKHRRAVAQTLAATDATELMTFLETYSGPEFSRKSAAQPGFLVPFFALALFAGIRPDWKKGEISKFRPHRINFGTNTIHIDPEVSKINEKRDIKIQPNLRLWLEKYPLPETGAVPAINPDRILRDVRKHFDLGHDVLRHTYISMTVGAFRSVGDAALQAGNSEAVVRKHYLDLKSVEETDEFWRIIPQGTRLPEKMEKQEGRYIPQTKPQAPDTSGA